MTIHQSFVLWPWFLVRPWSLVRPRTTDHGRRGVLLAALVLAAAASCAKKPPADHVRVSGQVEATEVQVSAPVGGRLVELRVAEGDRVKVGDLIAQLDTVDAQLALRRVAAERQQAEAQLRLLLAGARPEEIRQADAQRATAEADVRAAEV